MVLGVLEVILGVPEVVLGVLEVVLEVLVVALGPWVALTRRPPLVDHAKKSVEQK